MLQRTPVFSRAGGLLCVLGATFSLVTTASSAAEDQVARETAQPLPVAPSIPPQIDLPPVAVTLRKMSKTHEGPADVSAKSSLLSGAIPREGVALGTERTVVRSAFGLATGAVGGQGCDVVCDPGALAENEPDCGLPEDTTNGGCNSVSVGFTPIACGDTFCGTAANDLDLPGRDTDHYELVLVEDTIVTWTVTAEFDVQIGILDNGGVDDCLGGLFGFLVLAVGAPCETVTVQQALPPGRWWFFVAPQFTDPVECGAEYVASLECAGCDPSPNDVIFVDALLIGEFSIDGIAGNHNFGTSETFDSIFPGQGFTVQVSSGPSGLPGFDWHTSLDFANFGLVDFAGGTAVLQLQDINLASTLSPISDVTVVDGGGDPLPGMASFDIGSIEFDVGVDDLIAGGGLVGGGGIADIHWAQSCPGSCTIFDSIPPDCAVDGRQPHELNNADMRQGWDSILMEFECTTDNDIPTSSNEFLVTSDTAPTPNITLVNSNGVGGVDVVEVFFDQLIPPGGWTCLTHIVSGEKVCIGSLPGDVNRDRTTAPADILGVIDCLNGVARFPCELANTDIDRSDELGPPDILRVIDLLNGASQFDIWLDATIGQCP